MEDDLLKITYFLLFQYLMEILDKKVFNVIFTFMEKLSTKPNVQYSY